MKLTLNFGLAAYSRAVYFPIPLEHPVMRTITAIMTEVIVDADIEPGIGQGESMRWLQLQRLYLRLYWIVLAQMKIMEVLETLQLVEKHIPAFREFPKIIKIIPTRPVDITGGQKYFLTDHSRFSSPVFVAGVTNSIIESIPLSSEVLLSAALSTVYTTIISKEAQVFISIFKHGMIKRILISRECVWFPM